MIDFQIQGHYDQFVKTHVQLVPTFASPAPLWTKSPLCPVLHSLIPTRRHQFLKLSRKLGVELTRYAVFSQGHLFY